MHCVANRGSIEDGMSITIFPHLVRRQSELQHVTVAEFECIANFRRRVEQLHSTKMQWREIPIATMGYDSKGQLVSYENNVPEIDHILALAVRFRLLFAEKEPTRFEKIINILRRRAVDEWAQNYLESIRGSYLHAMKSDDASAHFGKRIDNRSMISLWFNSEFFHSEEDKRKVLLDINEIIGEKGSLFHLYIAIKRSCVDIDRLYAVLHKFEKSHPFVYTPNYHFRKSVES